MFTTLVQYYNDCSCSLINQGKSRVLGRSVISWKKILHDIDSDNKCRQNQLKSHKRDQANNAQQSTLQWSKRTCCAFLRSPRSRLSTAEFHRVQCSPRWLAAAFGDSVQEDRGSDQSSPPNRRSSCSCDVTVNNELSLHTAQDHVLVHVSRKFKQIITKLSNKQSNTLRT